MRGTVRKIALIIGGGPGGGAYAAGAVVELLTALEANEASAAPTLDVIVGGSAGALPAALAARALVVNPTLVPWIERAWLDALDADVLLDPDRPDRGGLLDGRPVAELASTLIAGEPAADDRTSAAFGGALEIGFPLTPVRPAGSALRSAAFRLQARRGATDPVWDRIAATALAASATPGLLPPRAVRPDEGPEVLACDGQAGGEPLADLARRLVGRVADGAGATWDVLVVEPRLFASPGAEDGTPGGDASGGLLAAVAAALGGRDAAAAWHDEAVRRDRSVAFSDLAAELGALSGDLDDPRAVATGRRIGVLAERVADRRLERGEGPDSGGADPALEILDRELERIPRDPRYAEAFRGVETRAGRTRLAKLVFVLEEAAGIAREPAGRLHAVAPPPGRALAGPALAGLAGPLCRDWRVHDFRSGRHDMRRVLREELTYAVSWPGEGLEAEDRPEPLRAGLSSLPAADRRRLDRFLEGEVDRWLETLRPGGLGGLFFGMARSAARRAGAARLRRELEGVRV